MKLLTILLFLNISCYAQNKFVIEVHISNSSGKKIYLANAWGGPLDRTKAVQVDSTFSINDTCSFTGQFNETAYFSIAITSPKNFAPFIIDTGKIIISGDANDYLWKSILAKPPQNKWQKEAELSVDSI